MPILIQRMIFDYVPKNAPFWIRPIVRTVFDQLQTLLVEPEIKKNLKMVCGGINHFIIKEKIFNFDCRFGFTVID